MERKTEPEGSFGYAPEELLQAAAWLARRYTAAESSSVPYETAQMLMGAVLYCLREELGAGAEKAGAGTDVSGGRLPDVMTAYRNGYDKVVRKVYEARDIYDSLLEGFEDYGCRNYRDTIWKGMPAFFLRYDARFCPQEHLLTLDYPLLGGVPAGSGAGLILSYLQRIRTEVRILSCFDRQAVIRLLSAVQPEYEELYLDNLCEPVLLAAVLCFLGDRQVFSPAPERGDLEKAAAVLEGLSGEERTAKVKGWLRIIERQLALRLNCGRGSEQAGEGLSGFLEQAASQLAQRLWAVIIFF